MYIQYVGEVNSIKALTSGLHTTWETTQDIQIISQYSINQCGVSYTSRNDKITFFFLNELLSLNYAIKSHLHTT